MQLTTRRVHRTDEGALDVVAVHAAHAEFVWLTLQRFGVREADLEDALQEVFVVVHQRLHTFDGTAKMTTWLYGICQRVAIGARRKAHVRREQITDEVPEEAAGPEADPEARAVERQGRAVLQAILDELDAEKRAVFVMFEIDGMSCEEIADVSGVPVGTVYSRLHAARKAFQQAAHRWTLRQQTRGGPR